MTTIMHTNFLIALENYFKFEIISQCDETKLHIFVCDYTVHTYDRTLFRYILFRAVWRNALVQL